MGSCVSLFITVCTSPACIVELVACPVDMLEKGTGFSPLTSPTIINLGAVSETALEGQHGNFPESAEKPLQCPYPVVVVEGFPCVFYGDYFGC